MGTDSIIQIANIDVFKTKVSTIQSDKDKV